MELDPHGVGGNRYATTDDICKFNSELWLRKGNQPP
jgi:hypothetical protein